MSAAASIADLKSSINTNITQNTNRSITGTKLNTALIDTIDTLDTLKYEKPASGIPASDLASGVIKPALVETTWSALKTLRDGGNLVPGQQYRITDYTTTTTQENTQSAGHQFDIIVTADSASVLNENARAIQHSGDTYFANSDLSAWELKYSIDNDTTKYAWAMTASPFTIVVNSKSYTYQNVTRVINGVTYYDFGRRTGTYYLYCLSTTPSVNDYTYECKRTNDDIEIYEKIDEIIPAVLEEGKGVIYYMKDEYANECPYDFKNIMFKPGANARAGTVADVFYYTFTVASGTNDATIQDHSKNGNYCYSNKIGVYIVDRKRQLSGNVFRNISSAIECRSNTLGDNCYSNLFGTHCYSNTFGNNCYSNVFNQDCFYNTFKDYCYSNIFGYACSNNMLDASFRNNTFGNYCSNNTFGSSCSYITFGENCFRNTFGNLCNNITFGNDSYTKSYYSYIIVENGNQYIRLYCSSTTSSSSYYKNVKIAQGVNNTTTYKDITDSNVGQTFQTIYQPANSQTISI